MLKLSLPGFTLSLNSGSNNIWSLWRNATTGTLLLLPSEIKTPRFGFVYQRMMFTCAANDLESQRGRSLTNETHKYSLKGGGGKKIDFGPVSFPHLKVWTAFYLTCWVRWSDRPTHKYCLACSPWASRCQPSVASLSLSSVDHSIRLLFFFWKWLISIKTLLSLHGT